MSLVPYLGWLDRLLLPSKSSTREGPVLFGQYQFPSAGNPKPQFNTSHLYVPPRAWPHLLAILLQEQNLQQEARTWNLYHKSYCILIKLVRVSPASIPGVARFCEIIFYFCLDKLDPDFPVFGSLNRDISLCMAPLPLSQRSQPTHQLTWGKMMWEFKTIYLSRPPISPG